MKDEEKRNPFTSSPPRGDVCLFVCLFAWRSIRGGEDESRKKREARSTTSPPPDMSFFLWSRRRTRRSFHPSRPINKFSERRRGGVVVGGVEI